MIKIDPQLIPSKRDSYDHILDDNRRIVSDLSINSILHKLPSCIVIVNENRQLVYINKAVFDMLEIKETNTVLGMRPGELVRCVNALKSENGCGTSDECSICGIFATILECFNTNTTVTNESHIRVQKKFYECSLEYNVTASPIMFNEKKYAVVTLHDISGKNRRNVLERIFFHDIINYASGLMGALDLLNEDPKEFGDLIPFLSSTSQMLFNEINSQKRLVLAENNELEVCASSVDLAAAISRVVKLMSFDAVSKGKQIEILTDVPLECTVDPAILERVIANLVKNALEASGTGSKVKISYGNCEKGVFVSVQNDRAMSDDVKYQIYQKSFSTKGNGRGLGTFSVKLLTEKYLKGSVSFESNDNIGTVFTVVVPV
jgi:nitrogen-specific signal transduction histidine kinase